MFKKRHVDKKIDVNKDIEDIQINEQKQQPNDNQKSIPKSLQTKKINKFSNHTKKQAEKAENQKQKQKQKKPMVVKYGLIDKDEVNSKYHANQETEEQKQPEKHSVVNLYVKKKMEQLAGKKEQVHEQNDNAQQIMQMQKKYLQKQQKMAQYDIAQILKKLQNMATNSIKSEIQNRSGYLKNLLQNEHQKMQYASKKQLKTIKQHKQRIENQFQNKYNESGRRAYVEKMKYQSMFNK